MTDDVQGQGNGHEPGYGLSDVALDALDIVVSAATGAKKKSLLTSLETLIKELDAGSARQETLRHIKTYKRLLD